MSPRTNNTHAGLQSEARAPGFTAEASAYRSPRDYPARRASPPGGQSSRGGRLLSGYDPRWPLLFQAEQRRIRAALGTRAIAIEHVGSSSVPGLGGRPEIDILVGVSSADDIEQSARLLKGLGYVTEAHAPPPSEGWCLMSRPGPTPFELLLVKYRSSLWRRHLWLRDYLRRDPARALAYGRSKAEWAAKYGSGTDGYKEAKRRFWAAV